MKLLNVLILAVFFFSFGKGVEDIGKFFDRGGFVIEKLDGKVIIDLGKGKAFVGEIFSVFRKGKEIVHPVTKEVLGTVEREVGKLRVVEVKERFSIAEVMEDKGIEEGDKLKLSFGRVCFLGGEEGYFRISSLIGEVRKGKECDYVVKEFKNGFGVEYRGRAVAFFEKPTAEEIKKREVGDLKVSAKFLITFPELPLSADTCDLFGNGKEYLVVLFGEKLKVYEILEEEVVEYASLNLPAGYPISVQCAKLSDKDVVLLNIFSGSSMSSAVAKIVGSSLVIVKENIPFFMAVLDKGRPKETFVGQSFDENDLWGKVRNLEFNGDEVVERGNFPVPSGFRVDSAIIFGDLLVFTDSDGYLRVYRGKELLLSEEDFAGSYTTAQLPSAYEGEDKYTFNPRHFTLSISGRDYVGVIRNLRSPVYRFLDVTKFTEGEMYVLVTDEKGHAELRKVKGKKFGEAIQAVVRTRDGRLFVLTGRTGTLPLQNRGDLFEIKVTSF